ncbi:tRNA (adenosine(37)-N6)-threonylcarbamoyltransferase complex ATPase subunit type 1 TsaE [Nitratiruptor sp. YY09-18]|uniref:tRNA (adenosine(37)-N6)-threonylcarbamoyltransferase complex ATPase subunit type 1 TsaE n=1 Tax=Nitratiruptor sp. YY09-18 TaxID=2724901 RepID=UPI001914DE9C|nr:tRNA (adenosine(37)-N6)-threonylcarbamoyltransferase complex ATPase subunit type 1 TsaE [Nitratiruptor sp. YY09-18]BCD68212.1 tRNA threonylcarbamoyladenosine biosynthesis protein TsaE [Nitratiruptor sp. YY09-18]
MKVVADLANLESVVDCIKKSGKHIILLEGDLGSGKTTLVRAFAKSDEVTSPTFSIQQVYPGSIYHYDLYNAGFEKFMELGLFEELVKEGYHFIEWPSDELKNFLNAIGFDYLSVKIKPLNGKREYTCTNL